MSVWADDNFIEQYDKLQTSTDIDKFEVTQNLNSVIALIPADAKSILDYGCCNGLPTKKYTEAFPRAKVYAYDISKFARELAAKNAPLAKVVDEKELAKLKVDCVILKLVLQFVEDLDEFVGGICEQLNSDGSVVISFPHPAFTRIEFDLQYDESVEYENHIASSDMIAPIKMYHRSLANLLAPFLKRGFVVDAVDELIDYDRNRKTPRRLNLRLGRLR